MGSDSDSDGGDVGFALFEGGGTYTPRSFNTLDDENDTITEKMTGLGLDIDGQAAVPSLGTKVKSVYREASWDDWAEWDAVKLAEFDSITASNDCALVVRRERSIDGEGRPMLALHSIKVQSSLIKAALRPVFKDYPGINTNLRKLEFEAPFHEFFFRWGEFVAAKNSLQDDELSAEHFDHLFQVMEKEMEPHFHQVSDLLENNVISFDYVWALFEPGAEVYRQIDGKDRLFQVVKGKYEGPYYYMTIRFVDTDGETFGFSKERFSISSFSGLKKITDLEIFPSCLLPAIDEVRSQLLRRGRDFEACQGMHFRAYSDFCTPYARTAYGLSSEQRHIEDGRVMIDCTSYDHNRGGSTSLNSLAERTNTGIGPSILGEFDLSTYAMPVHVQTFKAKSREARERFSGQNETELERENDQSLSDPLYALCNHEVRGYCFKIKEWAEFNVDGFSEIVWNETAFGQLVLPDAYKSILWAFIQSQVNKNVKFDDIVQGKGKGVIMLLSGNPGTGKTLTTESVAEAMKRPLYSLSTGEIGVDAMEVEKKLLKVLELCQKWNAILLLDECDVFLERRSDSSLARNQLVCVFLRLMEYYQGVMFLTTNRIDTLSPAFESRIDLTIHYPDLDFESRLRIWQTFIQPGSNDNSITMEEVEDLATIAMNGRQIKNVIKTARMLAGTDKKGLGIGHLQTILKVKREQYKINKGLFSLKP